MSKRLAEVGREAMYYGEGSEERIENRTEVFIHKSSSSSHGGIDEE